LSSLISMILAFVALVAAFIIEGGHPDGLLSLTAAIIVFIGTGCAVVASFPMSRIKKIPKILKVCFGSRKSDLPKLIYYFKEVSTKTRRNGLLSLESEITGATEVDPFIKKGLQMVVDGLEPQSVKGTLELQVDMMSERHHEGAQMFEAAGGLSPTLGIIGTVMGLVHVLGSLGGDSSTLGETIAPAFIATLYGVAFANLVYIPICTKLKSLDAEEVKEKLLVIEAVTLIQEGVNPNVIGEKLKSFLDGKELAEYEQIDKAVEA